MRCGWLLLMCVLVAGAVGLHASVHHSADLACVVDADIEDTEDPGDEDGFEHDAATPGPLPRTTVSRLAVADAPVPPVVIAAAADGWRRRLTRPPST